MTYNTYYASGLYGRLICFVEHGMIPFNCGAKLGLILSILGQKLIGKKHKRLSRTVKP